MTTNLKKAVSPGLRADLIRGAVLAILTVLLWSAIYHRWSAESWQTPIAYLSDRSKADVIDNFAAHKAAREGHIGFFGWLTVPELGAPYDANWNDFPVAEKALICFTGFLTWVLGPFAGANFAVMWGQLLAALAFFGVCRYLNANWIWAFAGALVFAFSRYAFSHAEHHLGALYYWHVPLDLLVCIWLFSGEGLRLGEKRFYFALAVAFVTGVQLVYYTNLFAQFVLFAGLLQMWRHGWRAGLPALAVIGMAAGAFLFVNLNTIFYHLAYGDNPGALVRSYNWLEVYGLKLVDLVVPPPEHRFGLFSDWGTAHMKEVYLSPGEIPMSGYLGLAGLGALGWLTAASLRRVVERRGLPLAALMILWIVIYAGVGGINGIGGVLGFQLFRATTRYSIVILAIVLIYAVRRLSEMKWSTRPQAYAAALVLALVAVWDQSPPFSRGEFDEIAAEVASDRDFTEKMERQLPPKAMIFQIPVMEYPESPGNIGAYDHLRPYLYSRELRYSFGSDKGRSRELWQRDVSQLSLDQLVARLESFGFAGLYINRQGFQDQGKGLLDALQKMGRGEMIESRRGDLVCVILKPSPQPVLP